MANSEWWLAGIGDTIIWTRLTVLESGAAEVLNSDGRTLHYADETEARMALLDAEFRAFEGLDEEDAAILGFDLDSEEPPRAETDDELVPLMTQRIIRGTA